VSVRRDYVHTLKIPQCGNREEPVLLRAGYVHTLEIPQCGNENAVFMIHCGSTAKNAISG
jgi:hypothetical protein